jgi:hypothetical protein
MYLLLLNVTRGREEVQKLAKWCCIICKWPLISAEDKNVTADLMKNAST